MAVFILIWSMAWAFHASCAVKRDTTHTHTRRERKRHSHMHNLLVTHAKYVENETTCLGSRNDNGDVRAKLLGWHRTKLLLNIRDLQPVQTQSGRERERYIEGQGHTQTPCWLLEPQTAVSSWQRQTHVGGVRRKGKWPRIKDLCTCSLSLPLFPSPLFPFSAALPSFFRSAFKFALLLQICLITVFFLIFFFSSSFYGCFDAAREQQIMQFQSIYTLHRFTKQGEGI